MLALRYVSLVTLSVWVGGLLALGAIATPALFDVLTARYSGEGRVLAGAVLGEVLRRFHQVSYTCAGVFLGSLTARAILGPRPRHYAIRAGLGSLMLLATLYSAVALAPRIERLAREIGISPSSLAPDDPRRIAFGRLHTASIALESVPVVGGLLLLFWELKD